MQIESENSNLYGSFQTCSAELFKGRVGLQWGKQKIFVFTVTRPNLFFTPDPNSFFLKQICLLQEPRIMSSIAIDGVPKITQIIIHIQKYQTV